MNDINIILGPPGTGKTSTLMDILDFEVNTKMVPIDKIAFVTFTRKGVQEGIDRAAEQFSVMKKGMPYFKTLHSLAYQYAGVNHSNLMDRSKYYDFSRKLGMSFTGYYDAELQGGDDKYLFWNDLYRNNKVYSRKLYETLDTQKAHFVMSQYLKYKQTFGYADYTDLIERFVNDTTIVPVEVAIIDEAQDLTSLQWKMVWTAFAHCKRIYIAGDDDQSIYQWSGADVNAFLNIHGHQEILKESWRLPDNLVTYSKKISARITQRIDKEYHGQDRIGSLTYVNKLSEIIFNRDETYLCLSRNNVFLPYFEEWVNKQIVPYKKKGEDIIIAKDLAAIKEYEQIRKSRIMTSVQRRRFSRLLGANINLNNPWYESFNWSSEKILLVRSLIAEKRITDESKVNISTIHAVKGGEADNVIIMQDITKPVKEQLETDPDSEHRVFYVAATRAKKNIIIVKPQTKNFYGGL